MVKKRILVVDDDGLLRELLQEVLCRKGYSVDVARDGLQALERLQEADYDLVLSDVQMPRMDGIQLLDEARRSRPELTVILMSTHPSPGLVMGTLRKGAFDFIVKPFSLNLVEEKVERSLRAADLRIQDLPQKMTLYT